MSSLTGLASASITSIIQGMCTAGQMKLVGASSASGSFTTSVSFTPASITIPALTGSQIAIIYLEVYTDLVRGYVAIPASGYQAAASGASTTASASGTGVNLGVAVSKIGVASAGSDSTSSRSVSLSTSQNKNSAFCTTTTGNQTITFTGSGSYETSGNQGGSGNSHVQACVFIYTPPF